MSTPEIRPARAPSSHTRSLLKGCLFFGLLVGVIILVQLGGMEQIINREWANAHLRSRGMQGVFMYMGLVAVLSPLGMPRQVLSAIGGYTFGALMGTVWASIGLAAGCGCGFFTARFLGREMFRCRFGKRIDKMDAFLAHSPLLMSMALRLFPLGNNALTTIAGGLTRIPAPAFIGGSSLGYLPQTIIFALLGSGIRVEPVFRTLVSTALFAASTILGLYLYRRFRGENALELSGMNGNEDEP